MDGWMDGWMDGCMDGCMDGYWHTECQFPPDVAPPTLHPPTLHPQPPNPPPPTLHPPPPMRAPDVEEGGETVFKKEGRRSADVVVTDYKSCDPGGGGGGALVGGEGGGPLLSLPLSRIAAHRSWEQTDRRLQLQPAVRPTHASLHPQMEHPTARPHPTRHARAEHFKYKPRKGDAVVFYSLDPDLTINPRSLHGGCPVIKGEKWVATKWCAAVACWWILVRAWGFLGDGVRRWFRGGEEVFLSF